MNKYFIIVAGLLIIIALGIGYNVFLVKEADRPMETGNKSNVTITARHNRWEFDPPYFEVDQGDRVFLTVINEDSYDHGFAIDAFGVSQRLPAGETIQIEFVATKAGEFPYYCSVSCGAGVVDGKERGHFDQIGKFRVRSLAAGPQTPLPQTSPTSSPASSSPSTGSIPSSPSNSSGQAAIIAAASGKARELGYDTNRLLATFDVGTTRWNAYHASLGNALDKDPTFAFLQQEDFAVVYFTASANVTTPYLWIFVDAASGEVLHYYEP